jgi:PAS domain S-box-containing protein
MTAGRIDDRPTRLKSIMSDNLFQHAFQYAAIGMTLIDVEGRYLTANQAFCEMLGYPESELQHLDFGDITHPDDRPETVRQFQQLVTSAIDTYKIEKRYLHKHGHVIWVALSASLVRDDNGQPLFVISQIQDITDRKQIEANEREQRSLAEALRDAAEALESTLNFDELLDRILANVRRIVPYDVANIMLVNEEGVAHVARHDSQVEPPPEDWLLPVRFPILTTSNLRRMAATGQPLIIEDVQAWPGWVILPGDEAFHGYLGAPIKINDQVIGFINLASVAPHFFAPDHAEHLRVFANQAAIALENVRLIQAEREQSDLAEALRDTAAALNSTLNIDEVLDRILANTSRVVPHDAINLMLFDAPRTTARVVRQLGYKERGIEDWVNTLALPIADVPGFRRMIETGQPYIVSDARANADWVSFPQTRWLRAYVGVPIQIDREVVGFLNLDSATPHFFTPNHALRLRAFADQVAVAIRNARLFEATQRNVQRLTLMHTATVTLAHSSALRDAHQSILRGAAQLINAQCSGLALADAPDLLTVVAVHNLPDSLLGHSFSTAHGLIERAIQSRTAHYVNDYRQPNDRNPLTDQLQLTAIIGLPLIWQDQIIGLLVAGDTEPRNFSDQDVHILTMFATLAAAALAQNRAFNEAQAREVEARLLSTRLANAQEEERSRIAGLLHDAIGYHLVMLQKNTELIQATLDSSPSAAAYLVTNLDLLHRTHELVRSLAMDLDSKMLADLGLAPAVRQYIERLSASTGMPIRLHITGHTRRLSTQIERVILRSLQEAMTNALRHAQATEIAAQLHFGARALRLTVQDNGRGFDPASPSRGTELGLPQIRLQVEALRGEFILESSPGDGTMIALNVPIHAAAPDRSLVRVLIVDDHEMMRQGLRQMLAATDNFSCVGEAVDGGDALRQAEITRPDLIVMDVKLPGLGGIEATRQIVKRFPHMRIIVFTYHDDPAYLEQAMQAGAKGYLLKSDHSRVVLSAMHAVLAGEIYISPALAETWGKLQSRPAHANPIDLLTLRERQVLQLLAAGRSNQDIGKDLGISARTVEVHRHNIMDKLDIRHLAQLIQFAVNNGLV